MIKCKQQKVGQKVSGLKKIVRSKRVVSEGTEGGPGASAHQKH